MVNGFVVWRRVLVLSFLVVALVAAGSASPAAASGPFYDEMDMQVVMAKSRDLVAALDEIDTLEEGLRKTRETFKERAIKVRGQIEGLRKALKTGTLQTPVECKEVPDWDRGIVHCVRLDRVPVGWDGKTLEAGMAIDSRTMTEGERQIGFTFPEARARGVLTEIAKFDDAKSVALRTWLADSRT